MVEVLEKTFLFKGVSKEEITAIIQKEKYAMEKYKKAEIIAHQGKKCKSLSVVLSGKAVIQTIYENGKVLTLATFGESDIFAEALLFSKDFEYPATVICVEDCEILSLPKETILNIIHQNSKFTENILGLLSQKIVLLNRKINLVELGTIKRKICKLLLDNYKKNKTLVYEIKSKNIMAEELGIPRPSLSRELISMKNEGIIEVSKKEIKILDLEELENEFFE